MVLQENFMAYKYTEKLRLYWKLRSQLPEVKARQKVRNKLYYSRPEVKEHDKLRRFEYNRRPEVKARTLAYSRTPESKVRFRKYYRKPATRFRYYQRSAAERGIPFELTFEQFILFWQQPCWYCGDPLETAGLDRVDNSKGYALDNVVSCCFMCNAAKRNYSQQVFLERCKRISMRHPVEQPALEYYI